MRGPSHFLKCALALAAGWLLAAVDGHAGLTLVQREPFQGVGTLNAAAPGNLGTATGVFHKRAVGPRLLTDTTAASRGWSADVQAGGAVVQGGHTLALSGAAAGAGCFSAWYYVDSIAPNGTQRAQIITTTVTSTNVLLRLDLDPSTGTFFQTVSGVWTALDTGVAYPVRRWFELRQEWITTGHSCLALSADFRLAGGAAWTPVYAAPAAFDMGTALSSVSAGLVNASGQDSAVRGRYGMPSLYRMDTWADHLLAVADVADPPAGPFAWYVNPATGNDNNDGTRAASAWASVAKIDAESVNCGMFGRAGHANGDALTIDTTAANLVLGPASLILATQGLNVTQTGGGLSGTGEIQAWTSLANASFSLVSGASKTYQHTLSESNPSCVPWENDKWLNHATASSFTGSTSLNGTTYANVTAALEAVPGSFWTDGTTLYVHPFGDTNPANDGKTYTRSYHRGAPFGAAAVQLCAPDLHLDGLRVRKTCLADPSTNDPVAAYCYQTALAAGGDTLLENCYGDYGGKHVFGYTDNSLTRHYVTTNCQAEQGSPYVAAGGQTCFVDYANNAGSNGTATSVYNHCIINANAGLIGATTGATARTDLPAWICHNSGAGANQFAEVDFNGCQFGGAGLGTYGTVVTLRVSGGTCGGAALNATNGYFNGVKTTQPFANGSAAGGVVVARNCIILPANLNGGFSHGVAGTLDYQDCTLDFRATATNTYLNALFTRLGALTMTWRNNAVLGSTASPFALIAAATSADALAFDHNAYAGTDAGLWIATAYNDGTATADRTFAQWQALGQDAGSIVAADLGVLADDSLSAASPAIDLGRDLGPAADYTGATFAVRNDAGAFEYPLPALRGAPAGARLTEGGGVTLGVPVAGNGPFTYRWLCNGAPVAGATGAVLTLNPARPGQSGSYVLIVTNAAGSATSAAATVTVTPLPFSSWQANRFTAAELANAAVSGPLADPDGDGVCNLLEYAFGGDPRVPSAAVLPSARVIGGGDGPHLAVTYRRLINTTELSYVVGVSADLAAWDESQTQTVLVGSPQPTGDGRTESVTTELLAPIAPSAPWRFLRVKVIDSALTPSL